MTTEFGDLCPPTALAIADLDLKLGGQSVEYLEKIVAGIIRALPPESVWLTSSQTAQILGVCVSTLEKWRAAGKGPPYIKSGHKMLRYNRADLERWAANQRLGASK